jgi:putative tryptophan/tyrosine transport system substrate-binding protein
MRRREFIAGLGAAAWPLAARAQQAAVPVIGWLHGGAPEAAREAIPAFRQGLAETGYVEGRNVAVEYRWAMGDGERLPALAADLVRKKVSAIVTLPSILAASAAKAATQTIPVVFFIGADPIELGLVASFNRPGGNLTGVANQTAEIAAKRLQLLHELVPAVASIAMLVNPANSFFTQIETRDLPSAASILGVHLLVLNAGTESEIAAAFANLVEQRAGAILLGSDFFFWGAREQIVSLAARYAIPTMFAESAAVAAGGLVSYLSDLRGSFRQIGLYTGRILNGEKPSDLPVVQPTKFELVINLRTAKALGLMVPQSILLRADEVIE